MEIDHIFICSRYKAPEGDLLVDFGLIEGSPNTHPGQGTANRRFFFHNMMLELLWIEDLTEVQSPLTKPMRLLERCLATNERVSPFGIAFRPNTEHEESVPFAAWDYHPVYLPEFLKIQVAAGTPLREPMYFYLPFARRQDKAPKREEPMEHKIPLKEVTAVTVYVEIKDGFSEAASTLSTLDSFHIERGRDNLMVIEFDNGVLNKSKDFRPFLPLVFRW